LRISLLKCGFSHEWFRNSMNLTSSRGRQGHEKDSDECFEHVRL
jgi:hypothetical protein